MSPARLASFFRASACVSWSAKRDRVLVAPTCDCDVCSARRRKTRETVRGLDESNVHGIEHTVARPARRGGATGAGPDEDELFAAVGLLFQSGILSTTVVP